MKKCLPLFFIFLLLQVIIGSLLTYYVLINKSRSNLDNKIKRIREDIFFKNEKWDLSLYDADDSISNDDPIYIITSDGFIIERSHPIHNLLDLSRYSLITPYTSPATINTITNESWRVLAAPILSEDNMVGVILVAIYEPDKKDLPNIDSELQDTARELHANITAKGDEIDTSKLDTRKLSYDISFQIVNRYNKVLLQSNNNNSITRIPTYIDRSYVGNQLKDDRFKIVEDTITNKKYLTLTNLVNDGKQLSAGIIVVGTPIDYIYSSISTYALLSFLASLLLLIILIPIINIYLNKIQRDIKKNIAVKPKPKTIMFMKKDCKLAIDDNKLDIPYASYQYYFCSSLFQKPHKKWEADELLEIFGENIDTDKWRKVYDTMVALNKKTSQFVDKLFTVQNKRYFINTQLLSLIQLKND